MGTASLFEPKGVLLLVIDSIIKSVEWDITFDGFLNLLKVLLETTTKPLEIKIRFQLQSIFLFVF